jgi:hypothetical protein
MKPSIPQSPSLDAQNAEQQEENRDNSNKKRGLTR